MLKSKHWIVSYDNDLCFKELGWFKCWDNIAKMRDVGRGPRVVCLLWNTEPWGHSCDSCIIVQLTNEGLPLQPSLYRSLFLWTASKGIKLVGPPHQWIIGTSAASVRSTLKCLYGLKTESLPTLNIIANLTYDPTTNHHVRSLTLFCNSGIARVKSNASLDHNYTVQYIHNTPKVTTIQVFTAKISTQPFHNHHWRLGFFVVKVNTSSPMVALK